MSHLEKREFLQILEKYNSGNATDKEIEFLDAYYHAFDFHNDLTISELSLLESDLKSSIDDSIYWSQQRKNVKLKRLALKLALSAAAALVFIFAGLKYYSLDFNQAKVAVSVNVEQDIAPGGNKAVLTLSNGKKIVLTDASIGKLAEQGGFQISKTADGQLVYTILDDEQASSGSVDQFNVIETPKGGQYQVKLPDGSNVWLNSASTLTYPSSFRSHKIRQVKLNGEAYFEIAKDKAHPFIVKTLTQEIEVLGTHFNVNSYNDEPEVKTTLLEGSIKLKSSTGRDEILKPGQQSSLSGNSLKIEQVDTEVAVAWKNHEFTFESDDIRYVMRMVERWYNVEVEYEGPIPENKFGGAVSRFDNVSEVLKSLESTGKVRFKIEGKHITVSK